MQAIISAYKLKESLENYASNPRHVQNIQNALYLKVKGTGRILYLACFKTNKYLK
jgi:hypothetical protein